ASRWGRPRSQREPPAQREDGPAPAPWRVRDAALSGRPGARRGSRPHVGGVSGSHPPARGPVDGTSTRAERRDVGVPCRGARTVTRPTMDRRGARPPPARGVLGGLGGPDRLPTVRPLLLDLALDVGGDLAWPSRGAVGFNQLVTVGLLTSSAKNPQA